MKSKEEIEKALLNLKADLEHVSSWLDSARKQYDSDRKFFGEADRGVILSASSSFSEIKERIKLLEWVLEI